jgi:hypothetical protein
MQIDIETRLKFLDFSDQERALLRASKDQIIQALPRVLDDFYAHIMQWPDIAEMFADPRIQAHAKERQIEH